MGVKLRYASLVQAYRTLLGPVIAGLIESYGGRHEVPNDATQDSPASTKPSTTAHE